MTNQGHPLINQIRLSDQEIESKFIKPSFPEKVDADVANKCEIDSAKWVRDQLLSKLTALLDVELEDVRKNALVKYINEKHTQEECIGFSHGFEWAVLNTSLLLASKEAELKQAKEEIEELKKQNKLLDRELRNIDNIETKSN